MNPKKRTAVPSFFLNEASKALKVDADTLEELCNAFDDKMAENDDEKEDE